MSKYNLSPKKPVIGLSTREKIFGKIIKTDPLIEPNGESQIDLMGDTFWSLYKHHANAVEKPDKDRAINHAVMKWLMESDSFDTSQTAGNILGSLAGTSTLYSYLLNSEVIKTALEKQAEADRLREEAENMRKRGDGQGAADKDAQADALIDSGLGSINGIIKDPLTKNAMRQGLKKADEDAENANTMARAFGQNPSTMDFQDVQSFLELTRNSKAMKSISDIIGKARGISNKVIADTKSKLIKQVSEYKYTRRYADVTSSQRMMMAPQAPAVIRLKKTDQFVRHGLFGNVPKTTKQRKGSFISMVDGSGSIGREGIAIEKAIQVGIAFAVRDSLEKDRHWELYEFSYNHRHRDGVDFDSFPSVTSKDDWRKLAKWAQSYLCGGTDFDSAFKMIVHRLKELKESGVEGCDVTFWSDGEAPIDQETLNEFNAIKSELDVRLIYFQFGEYPNEEVKAIADKYVQLPDLWNANIEEIIQQITEMVTEHFFAGGD